MGLSTNQIHKNNLKLIHAPSLLPTTTVVEIAEGFFLPIAVNHNQTIFMLDNVTSLTLRAWVRA